MLRGMRVVFLHIPKTAGQSVHAGLVEAFGEQAICPARVNDQLRRFSVTELNRFQVFSGHLDWAMLDCLKGPTYVFTILRKPIDRILSFYFFLRKQGEAMTQAERDKPQNQGAKAAFERTPREYFTGGPPHLRNFLDDHYDNFYTYYFAGRFYRARNELLGLTRRGAMKREKLLPMALDNLSLLDEVLTVDDMPQVFARIRELAGLPPAEQVRELRTNVNDSLPSEERAAKLQALGADLETMQRLNEYCEFDDELWKRYANAPVPSSNLR